jgi:hypothetical protein
MEAELGEEKWQFIDGCQRDWDTLPPPGPPLTVGLDGGFIHAKDQKSRGEGWFEVIAGKSMPEEGAAKWHVRWCHVLLVPQPLGHLPHYPEPHCDVKP